jgi:TRAP-type mannitol/chloroaromatic compound transport system substrate-binding protein
LFKYLATTDIERLPKDLQTILITAMKLSAYDMHAHSNDASAKNWATMKKDYPNIKVKTFRH